MGFLPNSIRTPQVGQEVRSLTPARLLRGSPVGAGLAKDRVTMPTAQKSVAQVLLGPTTHGQDKVDLQDFLSKRSLEIKCAHYSSPFAGMVRPESVSTSEPEVGASRAECTPGAQQTLIPIRESRQTTRTPRPCLYARGPSCAAPKSATLYVRFGVPQQQGLLLFSLVAADVYVSRFDSR